MNEHIALARKLRPVVEKAMSGEAITNKEAFDAITMMPDMGGTGYWDGHLIQTGTRLRWGTRLMSAVSDLWAYSESNPENAPAMWEEIAYRNGYRIIPEIITATTAFANGECGWWGDVLYRSVFDALVYTPEQYPDAWEVVTA